MTTDTTNQEKQQSARTDDLLASGADTKDGARGFDSEADPQALQTGMEGIAEASNAQDDGQSERDQRAAISQTVPDNPGHEGNKQERE